MTCNTPLWSLLDQTGGRIGPIRSIGWSCQALAPICFIPTVLLNLHKQQISNTYLLGAKRRWLKVNCVERIGIWPELKIWNCQRLENQLSAQVYRSCILVSTKANGFPQRYIPNTSKTPWWVVKQRTSEKYTASMASSNKKTKRNLSEFDSENETVDISRFIVIKSLEDICPAKFLAFLIEKVISTNTRNSNLQVEVDSRRQREKIKNENL